MASTAKQLEWQAGWNMKEQELAYELNKKALDYQNAYNQPNAQLARLRAAGLNPLYYGLDGNSSNGAPFQTQPMENSVAQAQQAEQAQQANLNNAIANTLSAAKTMAEVRQMDAQTELTKQQIPQVQSETALNRQELTLRPVKLGSELDVNGSIVRLNDSNVKVNSEQVQNLKQAYLNMQKEFDKLTQDINESKSREKENLATLPVLQNQANLLKAQAKTESFKQENLASQTALNYAQEKFSYEKTFEQQVKNGYLPKQIMIDLGIQGLNFKRQQQEIDNLRTLGKLLDTQNFKEKYYMYIDGVKVGLFKEEDGKIKTDGKEFVDYWKDMRVADKLSKYAQIYQGFVGSGKHSDLLGSLYLLNMTGITQGLKGAPKGVGTPPPPIYY